MADTYIYGVARIRSHEMKLLDQSFMDQLLSAEDEAGAMKLLNEHGWGRPGGSAEEMFTGEEKKTWDLMGELVSDLSVFDVFLYENDYHNLKAAVKEACRGGVHPGIFISHGTIPPEKIETAVKDRAFGDLPREMQGVAEEAMKVLLKTRDGQLCDSMIDRAAMEAIRDAGKRSGSDILSLYGEMTAAVGDIKVAVRGAMTGKDLSFIKASMASCESLDVDELAKAAGEGEKALTSYLRKTPYAGAADELAKSPAEFERWCDNLLIEKIRPQLHNSFGLDPLAAYLLARRTEIKSVRIILTGKHNKLPSEEIRGRIRETYV